MFFFCHKSKTYYCKFLTGWSLNNNTQFYISKYKFETDNMTSCLNPSTVASQVCDNIYFTFIFLLEQTVNKLQDCFSINTPFQRKVYWHFYGAPMKLLQVRGHLTGYFSKYFGFTDVLHKYVCLCSYSILLIGVKHNTQLM